MSAFALALAMTVPVAALALLVALAAQAAAGARPDRVWSAAALVAVLPVPLAGLSVLAAPLFMQSEPFLLFEDMLRAVAADPAAAALEEAPPRDGARWDLVAAILAVWGLGALTRGGYELNRSRRLARRVRAGVPADGAWIEAVSREADMLGLRTPHCRMSAKARSPFVAGLVRPVLIAPAGFSIDAAGRLVIAHELMHIRRRDVLTTAAARLAGALVWFNPFWFAIERRRRLAVEIACDDAALGRKEAGQARLYARALLDAVRSGSGWPATVGFGVAPRKALEMRLNKVLNPATPIKRAPLALALAALGAVTLASASAQLAQASGHALDRITFTHLVVQGRTTALYGPREIDLDVPRFHGGQDIAAAEGTPVFAPAAGRVVHASLGLNDNLRWGNVVILDHGGGWQTLYAHLAGFDVAPGDTVRAGQQIARVGQTGLTTGPHLHVEVRQNGERIDPAGVLPGLSNRDRG